MLAPTRTILFMSRYGILPYRTKTGKEIILYGIDNYIWEFEVLFQSFSDTQTFVFVKVTNDCESADPENIQTDDPPYICSGFEIRDLNSTLWLMRRSLENLVVIQTDSDQCQHDYTVLFSLRDFTRLQNLRIDAHFLSGFHKLDDDMRPWLPAEIPKRPLKSLIKLLPSSLKRLDLHVRPKEIFHYPHYCTEIIEGLVDGQHELGSLRFVTLEEMQYQRRLCTPWPGQSPVTEAMIQQMQSLCASVDMQLKYVKRSWPCSTPDPLFNSQDALDSHSQDAPFHTRIYKPGTPVQDSNFQWRKTNLLLGTAIENTEVDSRV